MLKFIDILLARNATDLWQVVNNLHRTFPILSSFNKSVKIRLVATCHLQICYNLLKQLAASLCITVRQLNKQVGHIALPLSGLNSFDSELLISYSHGNRSVLKIFDQLICSSLAVPPINSSRDSSNFKKVC